MVCRVAVVALFVLALLAPGTTAMAQLWLEPRCKQLPLSNITQLVKLQDDGLAYAFLFERRPGELWVGTRFPTRVCFKLEEAGFVNQK